MTLAIAGVRPFEPSERPKFVGVYFLMQNDELVYIGQSTDIELRSLSHKSRRSHHHKNYRLKWNRMFWIPVAQADLRDYEGALVRALNPLRTFKVGGDKSRDAEILAALGIQPDETQAYERRISERNRKQWLAVKRERSARAKIHARSAARVQAFIEAAS